MQNKQTAVQFLLNELTKKERNLINKTFLTLNNTVSGSILKNLFEQALQMEREQIEDAFRDGQALHAMGCETRAPQYYKKAFKP